MVSRTGQCGGGFKNKTEGLLVKVNGRDTNRRSGMMVMVLRQLVFILVGAALVPME